MKMNKKPLLVELSSLVSGTSKLIELAPVVQKLDSAEYPPDKLISNE